MSCEDASAAKQYVRSVIPRQPCILHDKPVLKGVVSHVHLVGPEGATEADVMFATNQIQCVRYRVDVGSTLVGRITAVTNGEIVGHQERRHPTADAVLIGLVQARWISGDGIALRS